MPVYLDCNATTPIDPQVRDAVVRYMTEEFGNAGSRTHEYGTRALQAVNRARDQVAAVVGARREEVVFTSGATESNNLAILGLREYARRTGRRHIVSTQIEHSAVLEPLEHLAQEGFTVTLIPPNSGGWVEPDAIARALRPDTLLISVMHVNNETGVIQPLDEIAKRLDGHPAFFHTDAAQGFGKELQLLRNERIELVSLSGHKLFAPKGVGALIVRRRGFERLPITPLLFGGGQERGLRPGTLPVHLIVGLGLAAELAVSHAAERRSKCVAFNQQVVSALHEVGASINGARDRALPHTLNFSLAGLDSEAVMVALRDLVAISNGSACTSRKYTRSHVLLAMGLSPSNVDGSLRMSWCHTTEEPSWDEVVERLRRLRLT